MTAPTRGSKPPLAPLSLTIFFPCHNEEDCVESVARSAVKVGRSLADDLEVLVVDDGSDDATHEIAVALAGEFPELRVVRNETSQGYGGALKRGFREATREWIFYTDGDGQFDLTELAKLLPLLESADVVSAYRVGRQDHWLRRFNGLAWSTLVSAVFRLGLRDVDAAFKIYPRNFVDSIELLSDSNLIDAEMLAGARRAGLSIAQFGVRHRPRAGGVSTAGGLGAAVSAFRELFQLRRRIRSWESPR